MRIPNTCLLLLLFSFSLVFAQNEKDTQPNSPVFKKYRPPTIAPLLEQSDATYQMWQGFRVSQEANAGNSISQFELSIRYLTGRGFKADTVKAAYWTKKAADQRHLLAQYNLAIFQFNGWGAEWNPFDAYKNFKSCAEHGISEAQYVLAQFLTENLVVPRDWDEAYRWVKRAADSGYAPAKESLKEFERRGHGHPHDTSFAKSTLSGSVQSSSAIQLTFLNFSPDTARTIPDSVLLDDALKAALLTRNREVEKMFANMNVNNDRFKLDSSAFGMLVQSADAGSPEALALLGRCYDLGIRVEKDPVRAAMSYCRALRLDSPRAGRLLFTLLQGKDFFDVLRQRVHRSDADAMYVWVCLIALGFDRQLTDAQAFQMLERASASNHPQSLIELGLCYYAGRWTKRDTHKAEEFWRKASRLGSEEANVRLAVSRIRDKKKDNAITLLREAASRGSVLAEFALAYCYETGIGIARNKGEAVRLYRSSGQRGSQDAFRGLERMHDDIRPKDKEFRIVE
jgi:TPR repeat protein